MGQSNFLIKFWPDRLLRFGFRETKGIGGLCEQEISKRKIVYAQQACNHHAGQRGQDTGDGY